MLQEAHPSGGQAGDLMSVLLAGVSAKGEFHCAECGYGVTVFRQLPSCPMCGGEEWAQFAWSSFQRPATPA
jgi:hypothetical protein